MQAEWRSASMEFGEQCVIMAGITMMPELCADNWGTVSTWVEVSCWFIQMGDVAIVVKCYLRVASYLVI